jgi:hypothetical protein
MSDSCHLRYPMCLLCDFLRPPFSQFPFSDHCSPISEICSLISELCSLSFAHYFHLRAHNRLMTCLQAIANLKCRRFLPRRAKAQKPRISTLVSFSGFSTGRFSENCPSKGSKLGPRAPENTYPPPTPCGKLPSIAPY